MRGYLVLCTGLLLAGLVRAEEKASWVEPMKQVHARFTGKPGTFAQFGDSITVSMAFWAPLAQRPSKMSPDLAKAYDTVQAVMRPECWRRWKGPAFGSTGGTTVRWGLMHVDQWLKKLNPEVVVLMFGTNDLSAMPVNEYARGLRTLIDRCLSNGTVVILTTIPPRSGQLPLTRQFVDVARQVAKEKNLPLVDYYAEVLKLRPDDWDGTLAKFKGMAEDVYQVPTLISADGVHPSNPKDYQEYSPESLKHNGFALRNALTVQKYAEVIDKVLAKSRSQ
jgi:hypothetical protein